MIKDVFLMIFLFFIVDCNVKEKELETLYDKGRKEYVQKDLDNSYKTFQTIYETNPRYKDAGLYLGKILYFKGMFSDSIKFFKEFSSKNVSNNDAKVWLIKSLYAKNENKDELLTFIESHLKIDSYNLEVLYIYAKLLQEKGKVPEAIETYRRTISQSDKIALSHSELSKIYSKADLTENAEMHEKMYSLLMKTVSTQKNTQSKESK